MNVEQSHPILLRLAFLFLLWILTLVDCDLSSTASSFWFLNIPALVF